MTNKIKITKLGWRATIEGKEYGMDVDLDSDTWEQAIQTFDVLKDNFGETLKSIIEPNFNKWPVRDFGKARTYEEVKRILDK